MAIVTLTFSAASDMTLRQLVPTTNWLEIIDGHHDARHATLDLWLMERDRVLKGTPGKEYDFDAQRDFDKERKPLVPIDEMRVAWSKIAEKLRERGDLDFVGEIKLPQELIGIHEALIGRGELVEAPSAVLDILADMIAPLADAEAEGPGRNYEGNGYVGMLRGNDDE